MSRVVSKRKSSLDDLKEMPTRKRTKKQDSEPNESERIKFTFYVDREMHEELRRISFEKRLKIQKILEQGLDRWLTANGEPTYAALKRRRGIKEKEAA